MALKMEMSFVTILIAVLVSGATAQSSCTTALISLSPCLNYITGNTTTPSASCCSQLSTVVRSQPQCLCTVLNGGASQLGLAINQTQAMALPTACNVQTPPVSQCNAAAPTADAPTSSSDSPTGTSDSPASSVPAGNGSKTTPATTDNNSSAGTSTKLQFSLLALLLFIVTYAST